MDKGAYVGRIREIRQGARFLKGDKMLRVITRFFRKLGTAGFATVGKHLRFDQVKGIKVNIGNIPWTASQVVANQSGKFVYIVTAGTATLCTGNSAIFGWAQERARTPTVNDLFTANVARDAVYRVPIITGTYAATMLGETCDLTVSSSVQGVDLTASTYDQVVIVGGDVTNQEYVDVMINAANEWADDDGVA